MNSNARNLENSKHQDNFQYFPLFKDIQFLSNIRSWQITTQLLYLEFVMMAFHCLMVRHTWQILLITFKRVIKVQILFRQLNSLVFLIIVSLLDNSAGEWCRMDQLNINKNMKFKISKKIWNSNQNLFHILPFLNMSLLQ